MGERASLRFLYALAADAMLERESVEADAPPPSTSGNSGGPRQRIIRYVMRPKP